MTGNIRVCKMHELVLHSNTNQGKPRQSPRPTISLIVSQNINWKSNQPFKKKKLWILAHLTSTLHMFSFLTLFDQIFLKKGAILFYLKSSNSFCDRVAREATSPFSELHTINLKSCTTVSMNVPSGETLFAIIYTVQHDRPSLIACEELDKRLANENIPCCLHQHMERWQEILTPSQPFARCLFEVGKPHNLSPGLLVLIFPPDSLFVLHRDAVVRGDTGADTRLLGLLH